MLIYDRRACAIPDPDNEEVIITGGWDTWSTVSVYNTEGHQRDLADLREGRSFHACSMFYGSNVNKVYKYKYKT